MTGGEEVGRMLGAGGDSDTDEAEDRDETDEDKEGGVDIVDATSSSSIPEQNEIIIVSRI